MTETNKENYSGSRHVYGGGVNSLGSSISCS